MSSPGYLQQSTQLSIFDEGAFRLLDSLGAATFILDKNHTVIYWNSACEKLTGVKAESVLNTKQHWRGLYQSERPTLADVVLSESWQSESDYYQNLKTSTSNKQGLITHNWCQTPAGTKYLAFEASAIFSENGDIIGAIETLRDVTELKNAQLSLERVAENNELLFKISKQSFPDQETLLRHCIVKLTDHLQANNTCLWKLNFQNTKVKKKTLYASGEFDETDNISIEIAANQEYFDRLQRDVVIVLNTDSESHSEKHHFDPNNTSKLIIDVPVFLNDALTYIISISSDDQERPLKAEDIDFLRTTSDVLSNKLIMLEHRVIQDKFKHHVAHDTVTGLMNRSFFERHLNQTLCNPESLSNNKDYVIMHLDIDRFKVVNNICGHSAGDGLLKQIALTIKDTTGEKSSIARIDADEFGLLIENTDMAEAISLANRILDAVNQQPFHWQDKYFRISLSIGIAAANTATATNLDEISLGAHEACIKAKENGGNRYQVFTYADQDIIQKRDQMALLSDIQKAIDNERFELYLQGIYSLKEQKIGYYEVLTRMLDDNNNIVSPIHFIPAAERYDLMGSIDRLVVKKSIDLLRQLSHHEKDPIGISINLSANSVTSDDFLVFLLDILQDNEDLCEFISFELTETTAISNFDVASKFIQTLKEVGCTFALDDFGTGLSSFAYLKTMPFDSLKIDGIFVKDIDVDNVNKTMVTSINEVGHAVGLKTVAEYVENDSIKSVLESIGIDYAQGFGIQKPFPSRELFD